MRVVVIGAACLIEADAIVFHNDFDSIVHLSCRDGNVNRIVARTHTVLYGVFHKRLQRQRRNTKRYIRRIKVDKKRILKLRLLNGKVCAGMLKFVAERYSIFACDGGKVFSKVTGEVQRDSLRL